MYAQHSIPMWIKFEDYAKFTNSIESANYAFAMVDTVPNESVWPCDIEGTVYIGKSGGFDENFIFDKKNKDSLSGKYGSKVHQRMKSHSSALKRSEKDENNEKVKLTEKLKYKLFHEQYGYGDEIFKGNLTGKFLCLCLLVPPSHLEKSEILPWLLLVESELLFNYERRFKKKVLMNLAHKTNSTDSMKNKNSYSQKAIKSIRKQNLFELVK